jgi:quercetin dioxygenase-like cupin family protein
VEEEAPVVSLAALTGRGGPLWGTASEELNATLLAWGPGEATPEHVNAERDVLVYVVAGSGSLELDGTAHALAAGDVAILPKGSRRRISAGADGIRYLTAHRRRTGLEIRRRG